MVQCVVVNGNWHNTSSCVYLAAADTRWLTCRLAGHEVTRQRVEVVQQHEKPAHSHATRLRLSAIHTQHTVHSIHSTDAHELSHHIFTHRLVI